MSGVIGAMSEMKHVMEYLVNQRVANVDPRTFSDLFERLTWLQADNGRSIHFVLKSWLDSDDLFRVKIALGLEEAFLFNNREDMVEAFEKLGERCPELKKRCIEVLDAWDKSVGPRAEPRRG